MQKHLKPSEERKLQEENKSQFPRPVREFASVRLADLDSKVNPKAYILKNTGKLVRVFSFLLLIFCLSSCASNEVQLTRELLEKQLNNDPANWHEFRAFYPYQRSDSDVLPLRLVGVTQFIFKPTFVVVTTDVTRTITGSWCESPNESSFVSETKGDSIVVYPDLLKWYQVDSTGKTRRTLYLSTIHNHLE